MLKVNNNWENYEYYDTDIDERRIYDMSYVSINGKNYVVYQDVEVNTVYDHGHKYDVESIAFFISVEIANDVFVDVNLRHILEKDNVIATAMGNIKYFQE